MLTKKVSEMKRSPLRRRRGDRIEQEILTEENTVAEIIDESAQTAPIPPKKPRYWVLRHLISAAIPVLFITLFYILCRNKNIMDAVFSHFSTPVRNFSGTVSAFLSDRSSKIFSVMELVFTLGILWILYFIVKTIVLLFRRDKKLETLAKRLFTLLLVFLYIWAAFCWLWGTGYYGSGFSEKAGIAAPPPSLEELCAVAAIFSEKANELSTRVKRDKNGQFSENMDDFFASSQFVYDNIILEFPVLDGKWHPPQAMFYSKLISYMGFTGIYFPFAGETNINIDAPLCLMPATIAHELAHQRGITSEQEANFAAISACITSGDTVYEYSGYLLGLINLIKAINKADASVGQMLYAELTDEVLTDLRANSEYWAKMESPVDKVFSTVYDNYLKVNNQTLGMQSYGACVDLLVAWIYAKQ